MESTVAGGEVVLWLLCASVFVPVVGGLSCTVSGGLWDLMLAWLWPWVMEIVTVLCQRGLAGPGCVGAKGKASAWGRCAPGREGEGWGAERSDIPPPPGRSQVLGAWWGCVWASLLQASYQLPALGPVSSFRKPEQGAGLATVCCILGPASLPLCPSLSSGNSQALEGTWRA